MTMKNPQTCLSAELLRKLSHDELSPAELKDVEDHVSDCERCRQLLEVPQSDPQWQDEIVPILRTPLELPHVAGDQDERGSEGESLESILRLLGPTDDPHMLGRIGSYEVVGVIGRGGMGVVFKAYEGALNRFVAIKMLLPHLAASGAARKRFAREGQAAAAVIDDNVMPIYSVAEWQGVPYLVTQYSRGATLQQRVQDQGSLELKEILRIGMQTARGLAAAHAQGLVHRDVKPSNILLDGTVERALLTDFGLARAVDDASITRTGIIAGTPQYMSPEQARGGSVDARSDLFGLGCVLYAMCTGRPPFRAENSYAILRMITDDEPRSIREINPDIPEWLCRLISRLMAKSPDARFGNAMEVAALLEQCLAHVQQPTSVPLPASLVPCAPGRRSIFNVTRKEVIAMLGTIGISLLGMVLWQATEAPDISGQWTSDEWGTVVLEEKQPGRYQGTMTDSLLEFDPSPIQTGKTGKIELEWSRSERRFNGTFHQTWNQPANLSGKLSIRLVDNEIRGAWTTDKEAPAESGTPRLADLLWTRKPATGLAASTPSALAEAGGPVVLKIIHPDGSPAPVQHGVSIATMGYSLKRPRLQFFPRNKDGSISLPDLPDGEHLLLLDSGWEHRDLMTLTFPVVQPVVEWRLPKRTEFAGTKVELKSARAATDAGIEVLRLQIHNATAAALHVSKRDITLTTAGFRILSPRFLKDAKDHHPNRELSIDIAPGETKSLDLDWADWVRHGYWSKRFEPVAEVSPAHQEPGRVWVRPWLGNIGSMVMALTDPTTIVTGDEAKTVDTALPFIEQPKVQEAGAERQLPPVDGPPVHPKLADDRYVTTGIHCQKFREEDAKRPGGELMGNVVESKLGKDPLVLGMRVARDAKWNVGGQARVELVVRNASGSDVKFQQTPRSDNGLSVMAIDKDGKEHQAQIAQFDSLLVLNNLLLPRGHVVMVKAFALRFDPEKRGVSEPGVAAFHLPPGD